MKAAIYTLGCKVNSYESEVVTSKLIDNGYEIVDFNDIADIYIINTCTVTNNSDVKSRKIIREAIRRNPNAIVIAMGCFIEANKDIEIEGIDILLGNRDKSKIIEIIDEYKNKNSIVKHFTDINLPEFEDMEITKYSGKTRAFVKIQDGCENFCTYCIIPYVRGKCRSKDFDTVIKEITGLVNNGYKEIVLTGIHTGNYGVDINSDFASLLEEIVKIPNLLRVRISSIEITELNNRVLNILKSSKVVANHIHIPLQAGSNHVLKLMNRKYDLDYFYNKISEIRNIRPDISISTDIIVGFPGETDEDFISTLEFSKKIFFSKIHVFPYSIRTGTPASKFPNQIDGNVKKERCHKLLELSKELEVEYMNKFIGSSDSVLIEENDGEYSYGHTSNFLYVKVKGVYNSEEEVTVKFESVSYPYIIGEVKVYELC